MHAIYKLTKKNNWYDNVEVKTYMNITCVHVSLCIPQQLVLYGMVLCGAMLCGAVWCGAMLCGAVWCGVA